MLGRMPEYMPDRMSDRMSDRLPDRVPEYMPDRKSDHMTKSVRLYGRENARISVRQNARYYDARRTVKQHAT